METVLGLAGVIVIIFATIMLLLLGATAVCLVGKLFLIVLDSTLKYLNKTIDKDLE